MLTINTNLSSLIAQSSMKQSTNKLNQAIERMTTGFKINHASDNAANYAITNELTTKISSLDVVEDNVSQGIDMINMSDQILSEINDRVTRLRNLQVQASNSTYGEESLKAINAEVNALVDEVQRLYQTAEYNGIKLFIETQQDAQGKHYYEQESYADESSTFAQLGLSASSFNIHSQDGALLQTYDVLETDTLGDFLTTLTIEGFNANINGGQITISSNNGKYITGNLADSLGIDTKNTNYVASTEQSFNNQIPVTTESTTVITETTTTTTSTTNTTTLFETTTVETTTTRIEQSTTVTNTETLITDYTTTTTSTTQTNTIYTTATIETTTTTSTETISTVYTVQTETLMVPATAATFGMRSGVAPAAETGGFIEPVTRRDTSTMKTMTDFVNGITSATNEYSISTKEELVALANYVNEFNDTTGMTFVLGADIDLSSISNWTPIGWISSGDFEGTFDGNGHVISNLTIDNETSSTPQGLFGCTGSNSKIKNVGIEGGSVKGNSQVGVLVGCSNSSISNCYATGDVTGTGNAVGGLVGYTNMSSSSINNCYADCTVSGSARVGGLVGSTSSTASSISNCYATGTVTGGGGEVGGLVGVAFSSSSISNCYATGTVTGGGSDVGGLVGEANSSINNCYATGSVTSSANAVGGLVGYSSTSINNSYATGNVKGQDKVGGLVGGSLYSSISNSYATGTVTGGGSNVGGLVGENRVTVTNSASVQIDSNATVMTVEQIKSTSTYDSLGFTETNGWTIVNGEPLLSWQKEAQLISYVTATLGTTLGELGVGDNTQIVLPNSTVTVSSTNTIDELLEEIRKDAAVTRAELVDGVLLISTANASLDLTSGFFSLYNPTQSSNTETNTITTTETIFVEQVTETPVTETIWHTTTTETTRTETITTTQTIDVTITETILVEQVTETPVTETIWHTTTSETTRTETLITTSTISLSGSTIFEELGIQSTLRVTVLSDGTKNILNIAKDTTLDAFYSELLTLGIDTTTSGNTITFIGQGDSYIDSDNLEDLLNLSPVSKTMGTKTSNTKSDNLFAIEKIYGIYAPGQITMQVGITAQSESQIEVDVSFGLRGINNLRNIGKDLITDYISILDDILTKITEKQTHFGAVSNRLESVLEEITIQRDNLISSRSTIRDADIAEVSSEYIMQQILQQASATLLATANQSPSIALQLI